LNIKQQYGRRVFNFPFDGGDDEPSEKDAKSMEIINIGLSANPVSSSLNRRRDFALVRFKIVGCHLTLVSWAVTVVAKCL
jgi:hypothetical protein